MARLPLETPGPNKVYMGGNFTQSSVHDGGDAFANGKWGDGVWMFSLDGRIGPIVFAYILQTLAAHK